MIKIENLTKEYGKIRALDNVSFEVHKGEVLGFLGPNGAGKTTTMNIITGFIPPTSGKVTIDGYDVMDNPMEVKHRIGYLPEHPPLYFDMTVKEYLHFVCELKNVARKKREKHIKEILVNLKIEDVYNRLIKNLSKGYKQRVGFAQALIGNPPVLILDEPTVGLDPSQVIEIRKLISYLKKEHTIIFSSHILSEVAAVSTRVIIINHGKIIAEKSLKGDDSDSVTKFSVSIAAPKSSAMNILKGISGVKNVSTGKIQKGGASEFIVECDENMDVRKNMFNELARYGYPIMELRILGGSLEDMFLDAISKDDRREVQ